MAVWCKYQENAKIIHFDDPCDVPEKIVTSFGLNDVEISLQYFDKDFEEYVDLDDFSTIENKMKIKIIELNCSLNNKSIESENLEKSISTDQSESLNIDEEIW